MNNETINKIHSKALRYWLKETNTLPKALAYELDIGVGTVYKWVRGEKKIPNYRLDQIVKHFGINLYLFLGKGWE